MKNGRRRKEGRQRGGWRSRTAEDEREFVGGWGRKMLEEGREVGKEEE
jgi:hypothetical protein